jgi:osmotically-inducible protein OsmY
MVRSMSIDVDTNLGEVTLLGYVRSQEEIDRAVIIAKGVPGVTKVMSLLRVRTTE